MRCRTVLCPRLRHLQRTARLTVGECGTRNRSVGQDVAVLRQLVAQHEVVALAVGLPLDLEGMEGSAVAGVRSYAQQLTKTKHVRTLSFNLA